MPPVPKPPRSAKMVAAMALTLSLGAPVGWLILRALSSSPWPGAREELSDNAALYGYLWVSTSIVFTTFAWLLGRMNERLEKTNAQLHTLSLTDALTGLYNGRYFRDRLSSEWARTDREKTALSIVMVDLDHFKRVNDDLGHLVGDFVLAHVAHLLSDGKRQSDVACRVGGEEFVILCPATHQKDAQMLAERLRATLEKTPYVDPATGRKVPLTASFGVADRNGFRTAEAMQGASDDALYAAKRAGRNCVRAYSGTVLASVTELRQPSS